MKKAKKLVALLLTLAMVLSMSMAAFAGETTKYKIDIQLVNGSQVEHTYQAYQVFAGTVSADGELQGITWGKGISEGGKTTLLQKYDVSTPADLASKIIDPANVDNGEVSPHDFAVEVSKCLSSAATGVSRTLKDANNKITGYELLNLDAGYYFVKDADNTLTDKNDAYTSYVLKLVKNTTVVPKSTIPTVDKQVKDEADDKDTGSSDATGWGETADHAINEKFQFKLTADIPANVDLKDYKKYKVVFTDTMSTGVVFDSLDSVDVIYKNASGEDATADVKTKATCTATVGQKGSSSWTLTIADILSDANIDSATLAKGVQIEVVYTAHLNEEAQTTKAGTGAQETTNENKVDLQYSNNPYAEGNGELGKTPEDSVWVFTYEVDNTKYADAKPNTLAGAVFELRDSSNNAVSLYLKDGKYYKYDATLNAGETMLTQMTSGADGKFNVCGLDTGSYKLVEISAPDGYNIAEPVEVVIAAQHNEPTNGKGVTTLTNTATGMTNEIIDKSGSTIPETGGMGTKILYIVGAVLVLGAGVVLISRKRVSAK